MLFKLNIMKLFIQVKSKEEKGKSVEYIDDIKFQTLGCGAAIATSSMVTEMVKGISLVEAEKISNQTVAEALGGLPPVKIHCSNLAADALHEAITSYRKGRGDIIEEEEKPAAPAPGCVVGQDEYLDKGVWLAVDDPPAFKDLRTLILHSGDESVQTALELTEFTDRVILLTPEKSVVTTPEIQEQLVYSSVKVLTESRLLEIRGEFEVEKVLIFNIDEDEEYELFVDAVVIIE